jgi:hypothetical protein
MLTITHHQPEPQRQVNLVFTVLVVNDYNRLLQSILFYRGNLS